MTDIVTDVGQCPPPPTCMAQNPPETVSALSSRGLRVDLTALGDGYTYEYRYSYGTMPAAATTMHDFDVHATRDSKLRVNEKVK
jgi:hypothetical protein